MHLRERVIVGGAAEAVTIARGFEARICVDAAFREIVGLPASEYWILLDPEAGLVELSPSQPPEGLRALEIGPLSVAIGRAA